MVTTSDQQPKMMQTGQNCLGNCKGTPAMPQEFLLLPRASPFLSVVVTVAVAVVAVVAVVAALLVLVVVVVVVVWLPLRPLPVLSHPRSCQKSSNIGFLSTFV